MREMRATPDDLRKYGTGLGWTRCDDEDRITVTSPDRAVRVTIPGDMNSPNYEQEAKDTIQAYATYYGKDYHSIYYDIHEYLT